MVIEKMHICDILNKNVYEFELLVIVQFRIICLLRVFMNVISLIKYMLVIYIINRSYKERHYPRKGFKISSKIKLIISIEDLYL